ncbi:MAG TPA: type II secretion system F family protein [Candidatus Paceibacterota bacterium]
MLFKYKAKLQNGEVIEGELEAVDRFSASRELHTRGAVPISIETKSKGVSQIEEVFESFFERISTGELVILTKNLSGMLKAGLSLSRAISVLEKQTKNKKLVKVLGVLQSEITAGGTLSSGLSKYPKVFSKLFVSMTRAGEESGNLVGTLGEVGQNLEKADSLRKKVKGALVYPMVIISVMVIVGILMFIFIVPTLAKTFIDLGVALPRSTQIVLGISKFLSEHTILAFAILFGAGFSLFFFFKAKFLAKYLDYAILRLPVVGTMAKELNTARTARTIASLLNSGVPITRSIEITEDVVQNVYYKEVLRQALVLVEKGVPFSKVFSDNVKLYPIMMSEMMQVGEETGKLADMLQQIAEFYETEIDNKTKSLSTIIEPVLMVLVGIGVGVFAVSMITPLYSVLNDLK